MRGSGTRVAVVTGGGRGIGRGISMALADLGFVLVVNYRSDEQAAVITCREAEERGSPAAIAIRADVADIEQGRRLVDATIHAHGRVDFWVNNAGIAPRQAGRFARNHASKAGTTCWRPIFGDRFS